MLVVWVKGGTPLRPFRHRPAGFPRRHDRRVDAGSDAARRSKALRRPAGEQRLALFPSDNARIAEIDVFDKPRNRLPAPRLS
jgi:hypothetical protein